MTNPEEIRKLAYLRLKEADVLYNNGLFDGAFYLAGYSVELMLKAKICERINVPNLFDEKSTTIIEGISDIRKVVRTHNLFTLLIMSGLKNKFDADKASNKQLALSNSILFNRWSEESRYLPLGTCTDKNAENLINLLSGKEGILQWIENN